MKKADRIYKLNNLLQNRRFVTRKDLQEILEVARATLTRDIEFLRSQMQVPVVFHPELGGYPRARQFVSAYVRDIAHGHDSDYNDP